MIEFFRLTPGVTEDHLGFIPAFLSDLNPAKARDQLDRGYSHGGGWSPMKGWTSPDGLKIKYPGDPALQPLAEARLGDEMIRVYDGGWVAIFQRDGSFEVARMD